MALEAARWRRPTCKCGKVVSRPAVESTGVKKIQTCPKKGGAKMKIDNITVRELHWSNGGTCSFLLGFVAKTEENKTSLLRKFGAGSEAIQEGLWEEFWKSSPASLPIGVVVFYPNGDARASRAYGPPDKEGLLREGKRLLREFGEGLHWQWKSWTGTEYVLSPSHPRRNRSGTPCSYRSEDLRCIEWAKAG